MEVTMFKVKRISLIIFILISSTFSIYAQNNSSSSKDNGIIMLGKNNIIQFLSYEKDLSEYKGYKSLFKQSLLSIKCSIIEFENEASFGENLSKLFITSVNTNLRKTINTYIGLLDANNNIISSNNDIKKGVNVKIGSEIILVFPYNNENTTPFLLSSADNVITLIPEEDELYNDITSIAIHSILLDEYINNVLSSNNKKVFDIVNENKVGIDEHPEDKPSAMFLASYMGNIELVDFLYKKRASPYFLWTQIGNDRIFLNPFTVAVYSNRRDIIDYFLTNSFDINYSVEPGWNALLVSVYTDNVDLFKYLLSKGADIHSFLKYRGSPKKDIRQLATERKSQKIIDYLDSLPIK